jgi:hypothetical protein
MGFQLAGRPLRDAEKLDELAGLVAAKAFCDVSGN